MDPLMYSVNESVFCSGFSNSTFLVCAHCLSWGNTRCYTSSWYYATLQKNGILTPWSNSSPRTGKSCETSWSSRLSAHPWLPCNRSVAYANQNAFLLVSSSITVWAGASREAGLWDFVIEWKGGHMLRPKGTDIRVLKADEKKTSTHLPAQIN